MGLSWFEMEVGFASGPKAKALIARLRNPTADAYPMRLWAYCYMTETYRFEGEAAEGIVEEAAGWRGKRGVLVEALVACRFLDREGDALVAHGVQERLERAQEFRDAARERQRNFRLRRRGEATEQPEAGVTRDVTGDVTRDVTGDSRVTSRSTDRPTNQPTKETTSSLASLARGGRAGAAKLGPLGAQAVARVARGLRKALKPLRDQAEANELEQRIRAEGGVDLVVECWAKTCRERDQEPESVRLLLDWLRDLGPPEPEQKLS